MRRRFQIILFLLLTLAVTLPCMAGEPTDQVKQTTDKILNILAGPGSDAAKREQIREAVNERFDWSEMTRRACGIHWKKGNPEEKIQVVTLFGKLLEQVYMDKVIKGSKEAEIEYLGEIVDDGYALVKVRITTDSYKDIGVEYRLHKKGSEWLVYDVSIEGVSLVNNYRSQFNSIMRGKNPFQKLIKALKKKVG